MQIYFGFSKVIKTLSPNEQGGGPIWPWVFTSSYVLCLKGTWTTCNTHFGQTFTFTTGLFILYCTKFRMLIWGIRLVCGSCKQFTGVLELFSRPHSFLSVCNLHNVFGLTHRRNYYVHHQQNRKETWTSPPKQRNSLKRWKRILTCRNILISSCNMWTRLLLKTVFYQ